MEDKFSYKDEELKFIKPSCKTCIYSIDNGVNGCKENHQTLVIKFAIEECEFFKSNKTNNNLTTI